MNETMSLRLQAMLREPLLVFLLVGGAFFLGWHISRDRAELRVDYNRSVQAALAEEFQMVTGRPPSPADKAKLQRDFIVDELLFRDAIDRGMHLSDKQTKRRLIDKLRFLVAGAPAEPTEEMLINHYSEHLGLYRSEPQHSVDQVFFAEPPADPSIILAALRSGKTVRGDDYWMGHSFPNHGVSMLRGIFGQEVVDRLPAMRTDEWAGPFTTPRGTHFLRRTASAPAGMIPYAQAREQVRRDYLSTQDDQTIDREVAKLREKFDVQIAG